VEPGLEKGERLFFSLLILLFFHELVSLVMIIDGRGHGGCFFISCFDSAFSKHSILPSGMIHDFPSSSLS
jgi:hypothetical protein